MVVIHFGEVSVSYYSSSASTHSLATLSHMHCHCIIIQGIRAHQLGQTTINDSGGCSLQRLNTNHIQAGLHDHIETLSSSLLSQSLTAVANYSTIISFTITIAIMTNPIAMISDATVPTISIATIAVGVFIAGTGSGCRRDGGARVDLHKLAHHAGNRDRCVFGRRMPSRGLDKWATRTTWTPAPCPLGLGR